MFRLFHRASRVFVCAAIAFAAAGPARGVQVSLPSVPVQILGADSLCTSWTPGGTAGAPTLTCVTGGGGGAPFFCTLSGAPTGAIAPGTAVNLQMFCVGGSAPYTYAWTPGNSTAASLSANPTVSTTFSVTARDSGNGMSTQSANVTVSSGGGGGPISCPGFTNTVVLNIDWNNPQQVLTGNLAATDAVVLSFTTGPNNPSYVNVIGAEVGSTAAPRIATLSTSACDFAIPPTLGYAAASGGSTVFLKFSVGPNGGGYYPALAPNTPYFINVKTAATNCVVCNMYFNLNR
jgi:hypothetical protein